MRASKRGPDYFWDVTDTSISSTDSESGSGGSATLEAGPGHTILLRFGELNRIVGPGQRVVAARIVLTPSGGEKPILQSVSRLLVPWGEGPLSPISALLKRTTKTQTANAKSGPARGSATWRFREAGEAAIAWRQPGAEGKEDATAIAEATATVTSDKVNILGLAEAVQFQLDHPTQNDGFAIKFENNVDFFSSQSNSNRPELRLVTEASPSVGGPDLSVQNILATTEGSSTTYKAIVMNVGNKASAPFSYEWVRRGSEDAKSQIPARLGPGELVEIKLDLPNKSLASARFNRLEFRVFPEGPDANPANNALETYEGAKQININVNYVEGSNFLGSPSITDWVQAQISYWNSTVAPQSRFSFAPEGAVTRLAAGRISVGQTAAVDKETVQLAITPADLMTISGDAQRQLCIAAGAPNLGILSSPMSREDLFPDLTGGGDTRYDGSIPAQISLPYEPVRSPLIDVNQLEATYLLSATAVATLNAEAENKPAPVRPKTVLARVSDLLGRPWANIELSVTAQTITTPITATTDHSGIAILSNLPDSELLQVKGAIADQNETTYLKRWQLIDAASRGNTSVAIMDIRFNLPQVPIDSTIDLADNRSITDKAGRFPAQLQPLVTPGSTMPVSLGAKPGDWLEIDLRKDRTLAEVVLTAGKDAPWTKFDIVGYGTGQTMSDAVTLATETNAEWTIRNRNAEHGNLRQLTYRISPTRVRFIRLVNRGTTDGSLTGIQVHAARLGS